MKGLLSRLLTPKVDRLVDALNTVDRAKQDAAIEALVQSTDPEVSTKLRAALKHPSESMRGGAARALASRRDTAAFGDIIWLVPHSKNDMDSSTEDVIEALGRLAETASDIDRRHAVERLAVLLDERMPASLYATVPQALARLGDRAGLNHLVGIVKSTRPTPMRVEAAELIGKIARNEDLETLNNLAAGIRHDIEFAHLHNENPEWFRPILERLESAIASLKEAGRRPSPGNATQSQ